jgi:serine/threonine-protein kinase
VDFGIVKDLGTTGNSKGGPATGRLMLGVAAYSSPEVLAGKAATPAADVHAMGVVATMMLTGKHPFQRDSEVATIGAVLEEAPPPFSELCSELVYPPGLEETIRKALAKRPSSRLATAGELARRVRTVLAEAGLASPLANGDPSPSFIRNKPQLRPSASNGGSSIVRRPPSAHAAGMRPPSAPSFARHVAAARPPSFNGPSLAAVAPPVSHQPMVNTSVWFVPVIATCLVAGVVYGLMHLFSP